MMKHQHKYYLLEVNFYSQFINHTSALFYSSIQEPRFLHRQTTINTLRNKDWKMGVYKKYNMVAKLVNTCSDKELWTGKLTAS